MDRHLLRRLPARDCLACRPRRNCLKCPPEPHSGEATIKQYLVGAVLGLVLTAIPFGLVAARTLRPIHIFVVISAAAITQVVIHLRYFLHLNLKPLSENKLIALCFAAVALLILVGGSLWIMFDVNYRTMQAGGVVRP
jgi:cytochrome o ubiquinol oxidase operon protein cyoD